MRPLNPQLERQRYELLCSLLKETEQMAGPSGRSSDWQKLIDELKQKISNSAVKLELIKEKETIPA